MIYSLSVTNYVGDTLRLELRKPEITGFLIKSITGLGPVKANINTTEAATNDGSVFNSARLNPRNIVITMSFVESVYGETIEDIRQKSYKYFPIKKNVTLVIESDNRQVMITGYVESNEPDIFSQNEGTQISILCPDPYFRSANNDGGDVTNFQRVSPSFEFPFSNESLDEPLLIFSDIHVNSEGAINYLGDSEVGVIIHIYASGSAENIDIQNVTTGETMSLNTSMLTSLTGYSLDDGDEIEINTTKGEKSIRFIREDTSVNILNCLNRNSKWITLVKGDNVFAFSAEEGLANLRFRVDNKIIYEGI